MPTIKDLKAILKENNATWLPPPHLLDSQEIPKFHLGGLKDKLLAPDKVAPVDFAKLFAVQPNNPFILERRIAHKIVADALVRKDLRVGSQPDLRPGVGGAPMGGATPVSIDWRNRWGWPWITTIRDQGGSEACWCFAAVALVEAMVRIEHCVWPSISEGDVHRGMGSHCCDCGNSGAALDWMKDHAAADPGCFPWATATTYPGCSGCGGTFGGTYDAVAYTPTADRNGRSVRMPAYTSIASVAEQKKWLDTVGPIITWFDVWQDFFAHGSGVYHKQEYISQGVKNTEAGGHFMLIVGFDDGLNCWIVKNSWPTWGQNGFGRIGYGETGIDSYAKIGLQGTNPDPWTKRRLHNGAMLESGNGALHRNFEMLTTAPSGQMRHWWRDNSAPGFPWHQGIVQGNDVAVCPTLISTTFNRNFESVHLTNNHRLHHWWFEQSNGLWHDAGIFGPNDASGVPGFIQSNYGAPGNFEVVMRTADSRLNHWWRDGAGWHDGGRFGGNVAYSGASLVQGHYGTKGNFELVCALSSGQMQHFWRDNDHGNVWHAGVTFGDGATSPPCMIEGSFGAANENTVGNFELCVAVAGKVQHWWRANTGDMLWRHSDTFGHDVRAVAALVEGSYGFNLEVVVIRNDNQLQHYWRDGNGWHEGPIIGAA